ncbi:MAG TPA: hypothetical protein VLH38_01305 [Patescibacteria group bacterium]|nr:hypothetical protein [Patescibacteria group bacterium]
MTYEASLSNVGSRDWSLVGRTIGAAAIVAGVAFGNHAMGNAFEGKSACATTTVRPAELFAHPINYAETPIANLNTDVICKAAGVVLG